MPNYTLYYFNGRGRAEICRMLFAAGGVQYNDKRIEFSEWERCRNDFPCMRLPCLEMDGGTKMPEMMSISRYLSREFGFYPNNNMDMFRCDYICDCFYEMFDDYMRYFHWKNGRFRFGNGGMMGSEMQSRGDAMGSEMQSRGDTMDCNYDNYMQWRYMNSFNRMMPFLEKTLCMRNGGSHFFMGEQMMWCDMLCYCFMETFMMENQSMFSSYPKMMAMYSRVAAHPKISSYLKSRRNTNW